MSAADGKIVARLKMPSKKINASVATFYPNRYHPDSFTVLTYAPIAR